ncbi:hypothetical protein CC85DRAFT_85410 [Cutaneotrichosporon oleaginosum]|uniref:Copper acquisition factor BIM1-like domain-containing protein n=1 Tax=Cutaneotrichosporon oleaginosum TaxID=879819 RepID=A0A0J0XMY3_9TREE|nr:uncharacterized protein CC85DRAFT_85410 [Cutaneotrichosporon oleaginosum]KLT42457.1 hypothetical protein CC85DRAFT_85410 [Cutaneotrichosporon oleaginosum]TXT06976.1 hypothetical protein COLE_06307 [Cutaneotrichosporon oleaginosum]
MLAKALFLATAASAAVIGERQSNRPTVTVIFPPMRADTDGSSTFRGPCSGSSLGERAAYPLTGGQISLSQASPVDNINFLWTKDVTAQPHEFKTYGEPTVVDAEAGHVCAKGPDFSSLGFKAGDDATIMVMYQADGPPRRGTDKRWQYLCADVKLTDSWTQPANYGCQNVGDIRLATTDEVMNLTISSDPDQNGKKKGGAPGGSEDAQSATAQVSASGLSSAEAGGIGAGVTVGVFLLALGALFAMGYRFTKKSTRNRVHDDASSTSSYPVKQAQQ